MNNAMIFYETAMDMGKTMFEMPFEMFLTGRGGSKKIIRNFETKQRSDEIETGKAGDLRRTGLPLQRMQNLLTIGKLHRIKNVDDFLESRSVFCVSVPAFCHQF